MHPKDQKVDWNLFVKDRNIVDYQGRFIKRSAPRKTASRSETMQTPFEDTKEYVLTELGSQFVGYVMNELTPQIGGV